MFFSLVKLSFISKTSKIRIWELNNAALHLKIEQEQFKDLVRKTIVKDTSKSLCSEEFIEKLQYLEDEYLKDHCHEVVTIDAIKKLIIVVSDKLYKRFGKKKFYVRDLDEICSELFQSYDMSNLCLILLNDILKTHEKAKIKFFCSEFCKKQMKVQNKICMPSINEPFYMKLQFGFSCRVDILFYILYCKIFHSKKYFGIDCIDTEHSYAPHLRKSQCNLGLYHKIFDNILYLLIILAKNERDFIVVFESKETVDAIISGLETALQKRIKSMFSGGTKKTAELTQLNYFIYKCKIS